MVEIVSVEVPEPPALSVTEDELSETVGPAGEDPVVRLMVPEKLLTLLSEMVDVTELPCAKLKAPGVAVRLKPTS